MSQSKTSICAYCGCACKLQFNFNKGKIESVTPVKEDVISMGKPCIKGLSLHESLQTNRLKKPLIRMNGKLQESSWNQAYEYIYENIHKLDRNEIYFAGSGEFTNEANYLMSKFARLAFQTNNVDCCARLCHSSTAVAFQQIFGLSAIPEYTMDDLEKCDLFIMIGTDPKDDYPVMYNRIIEAKSRGAKIIVIDVGPSSTTEDADLVLKIAPNGIVPLLSHLMNKIIKKRDYSKDVRQLSGFNDLVANVKNISQNNSLFFTNLKPGEFESFYNLVNYSKKPAVLYGMGATQQLNGTMNVKAIASLSILLNAVSFSNRGKVNVQGVGDIGVGGDFTLDFRSAEKYWGLDLNEEKSFRSHKGKTLTEGLFDPKVKSLWIMGMNPAHSMPDLNKLHKLLKDRFVILQHHHPSETMKFADVVLPTTMLPEENGTITNGERRVRRVVSIGHDPMIKPNWQIWCEMARRFGLSNVFSYSSAEEIWKEIREVIPDYLPVKEEDLLGDGSFAYKERVFTRFPNLKYERIAQEDGLKYPFTLTTARSKFHFCSGEGTCNSSRLMKLDPEAEAYINPNDAKSLNLKSGDLIKLISEVGELEIKVVLDDLVGAKIVVLPYHFEKVLVNKLTPLRLDPESETPCFKDVPVKIEKV